MMISKKNKYVFNFASNIPGIKSYWVGNRHEFKSTSFFHSYIFKNGMGSITEYCDS